MDAPTRPLILPRGLIFLASIWLIGSWFVALGPRQPVHASSLSFEPGVRLMLVCLSTGLIIAWPLLRLSQDATPRPLGQTALDLLVLLTMVQLVLWPLRLVTTWTPVRTAAIDAMLGGWVILAGACVAAAIGTDRRGPRLIGMIACLSLCLLGPALAAISAMAGVDAAGLMDLSPFMALRKLADGGGAPVTFQQWQWIMLLFAAAAVIWIALGAWTAAMSRRHGVSGKRPRGEPSN